MHRTPRLPLFALAAALLATSLAQAQPEARAAVRSGPPVQVAVFEGLWCGTGLLRDFSLRLTQQRQDVQGTLVRRDRVREIEGRVEGSTLHTQSTKVGSLLLERAGDELRVTGGDGPLSLARGATFQRAPGSACSG
ncbi:hypothetical protein [Ramlibacter sp.]|uniref:hypothetical protein n=1 Tax=Ramlibacter sp. TaxID=1917967 RepID=UPI002C553997|nr:hypothetical protein [Ramlibacter sp.]HWI84055.1 hypothetical protein [Ramlibacter sp.]